MRVKITVCNGRFQPFHHDALFFASGSEDYCGGLVQIEKNSRRRNSEVHTKKIRRFSINRYIIFILKLRWQASFFHAISSIKLFCQTKFEDGAGSSHPGKMISWVMIETTANIFP